ncbi:hypothetical protein ACOI22_15845 [Glaciecola sp. 2405UD65-10]|uniref:hypothetical protein n=1 Tax=Glaciecola sp. 2405UD65-10 TaxID=3397244 RepID=UPI003B5B783C
MPALYRHYRVGCNLQTQHRHYSVGCNLLHYPIWQVPACAGMTGEAGMTAHPPA